MSFAAENFNLRYPSIYMYWGSFITFQEIIYYLCYNLLKVGDIMKKFLFVLTVFLILNVKAYATAWVQVGDYEYIDKDSIEYYVDDYGKVQYDKKIYWMKTINNNNLYENVEKMLNGKIVYCKTQWIIDTTKKSLVVKSDSCYDENGSVLASYSFKDYELDWKPIVPESKGELWFELVKKPRYLKKMYKMQLIEQNQ